MWHVNVNNMKRLFSRPVLLGSVPILLVSLYSFGRQIQRNMPDIPLHIDFIRQWRAGDISTNMYSLYLYVVDILARALPVRQSLEFAAIGVLTAAVLMKYLLAVYYIDRLLMRNGLSVVRLGAVAVKPVVVAASVLICLSANIIISSNTKWMTVGYLPLNVWHNSTVIFLMPLAVILFFLSWDFVADAKANVPSVSRLIGILMLSSLSALVKPSYWMVFAVAFPLYVLLELGFGRVLALASTMVAVSSVPIALVYRFVFGNDRSGVEIAPFLVWFHFTGGALNTFLAILASLAFPIGIVSCYGREPLRESPVGYAWIGTIVGIVIFALFAETGVRRFHGNFGWQSVACSFILFLCSTAFLLRKIKVEGRWKIGEKMLTALLVLHLSFGILIITKIEWTGTPY